MRLLGVLKKSTQDAYDHLGLILVVNILWFLFLILPLMAIELTKFPFRLEAPLKEILKSMGTQTHTAVRLALFLSYFMAPLVLIAPLVAFGTGGLFYLTKKIAERDAPQLKDFFLGAKKFGLGSLKLFGLNFLVLGFFIFDILFYLAGKSFLLKLFGLFWLYVLLFWLLALNYHFPFMVKQNIGVFKAIKKALILTLDNLLFTLSLFLISLSAAVLLLLPLCFKLPFLSGLACAILFISAVGLVSLIQNNALEELLKRYK